MKIDAIATNQRDEDRVSAASPRGMEELGNIDVPQRHKSIHHNALSKLSQHTSSGCVYLSRPDIVITNECPSRHPPMPGKPCDRLAQLLFRVTAEKNGSCACATELVRRGEDIGHAIVHSRLYGQSDI